MNLIKKFLFFTLPLIIGLSGCSINNNLPYDPVYDTKPPIKKKKKENLEEKTFNYPEYFYFSQDFDFDGIYDWADPWPYNYGPFIDMNNNGVIDFSDIKIHSWNPFWHNHFYYSPHFHNPWNNHWDNSFYWDYYFPNENKPIYYGPRKGNVGSTVPNRSKNISPRKPREKPKEQPKENSKRNLQERTRERNVIPYRQLNKRNDYVEPSKKREYQKKEYQKRDTKEKPKQYYSPRRGSTSPTRYNAPRGSPSIKPKSESKPANRNNSKSPRKR